MTQLDIKEASGKLIDLVDRARAGEEVFIVEEGKPAVRLVRAEENLLHSGRQKGRGMFKGQVWMSEDFKAPLNDEDLKEWGL